MSFSSSDESYLVRLDMGTGSELFLIHPVGGGVSCYMGLARGMTSPVYGLMAGRLGSIPDMAAAYLDAIYEVGCAPPFTFGGWSMGGVVAFEMARLLEVRSGYAAPVVMIDSYAPHLNPPVELDEAALVTWFADDWGTAAACDLGTGLATRQALWKRARERGLLGSRHEIAEIEERLDIFEANVRALHGYSAERGYSGTIYLFAAARENRTEPDNGWGMNTAGRVVVEAVDADHYGAVMYPTLAASINRVMEIEHSQAQFSMPKGGCAATPFRPSTHRRFHARERTMTKELAALAAVIFRRTAQEVVKVRLEPAWMTATEEARAHGEDDGGLIASLRVSETTTFAELCRRVQEAMADAEATSLDGTEITPTGLPSEALKQVKAALECGIKNPTWPVAELDLGGEERPPAATGRTFHEVVHELVEKQARMSPQRVAVSGPQGDLTYAELDTLANGVAAHLEGVGPGSTVAVLCERSHELIVALLGILKAGCAYLALDEGDPAERRARLMKDASASTLLTKDVVRRIGPASAAPRVALCGESLAYVAYTSGSTGTPRGVAVPHRGIVRLVHNPSWITIRPDDVFLQLAPMAFDPSTLEIWGPLVNGGRLALYRPGPVDLIDVADAIKAQDVTILWLTAGLFHQMVTDRLGSLGRVRHVLAGGDVVSAEHVRSLLRAHPHLLFTNGYGPTENTLFTTCWTTTVAPDGSTVPIGTEIDGTRAMVLDRRFRPVPSGVIGELFTSGDGLAWGYINNAAATAERFIPDPCSARPGGRMYRTGDLVKEMSDRELDFLGRVDSQAKVGGHRVEPATIENELLSYPEVTQAVVVIQRRSGNPRLIAYVEVDADVATWADLGAQLRGRLSRSLPSYLVPRAVIACTRVPLTANGKMDRKSLLATPLPRNVGNSYVPPRSRLERRLADVWCKTLDMESVGIDDDFFEMGGHSLLAAELINSLQKNLNVEIAARTVYMNPTIADLAGELKRIGVEV